MVDDKLFISLDFGAYKVTQKDVSLFLNAMDNDKMPESFIFETVDGWFSVNKPKMEFRIVRRKEQDSIEKTVESDMTIMVMYKVAKRSGYKCYLENKFMN